MKELPRGWVWSTLGQIASYGNTDKVEPSEIKPEEWVLELEDIEKDSSKLLQRTYNTERRSKSTKNRFKKGDVLYGKLRPYLNKVILADKDGVCTTEIIPLTVPVGIDNRYLFYSLKRPDFLEYVTSISHGVNMPRLGTKAGQNAPVPLATLNEQKRIADKLDTLLARVDTCRERLDRVPQILKRFRHAVLAAATTGVLTEEWREKGKIQSVSTKLLSKVVTLKTGPFGSALHKEDYVDDGIPVINPMHINDGRIMPTSSVSISADKADELKDFRLITGDVIIARRGVMGRCAVVTEVENSWLCGTGSIILRPTKDILPKYLQICLSSPDVVAALEHQSVGSTMVNINQGILLGLEIIIPSIPEQHEIVRRVETFFAFADRLEARYIAGREQVEQLTPSLLDKAFRGELVPQDPNDEPAEKLLEGIRTANNSETIRSTRKAPGRKSTIMKITAETVKKTILQMPNDHFSFDELRNALPGDYESLKDVLFSLLGETVPTMQQFFDPEVQSIRFKRVKL